jgi:tRNA threonylcarbamoyl adenosine modification protein YjeE
MGQEATSLELELADETATLALGRALGRTLGAGAVLLLVGELGAGKTTLTRGLAAGLGVDPAYVIASPTFTLLNIYPGRLELFHADLYRLSPGEADDLELLDQAGAGVLAVEWPERAGQPWPTSAVRVELAHQDRGRRARISGPAAVVSRLAVDPAAGDKG